MSRHSPQYRNYITSQQWYKRSRQCQKMTRNRCVLFPWMRSNHAHHMTYKNLGSEIPGRDIVPLSKLAHSIIHFPLLWKVRRIRTVVNGVLTIMFYILTKI